jgi:selenocysteine lyase/cysteine desulfurase
MDDLTSYRVEFPITKSTVYLNHASVSPLPRRTADAMRAVIEDVEVLGLKNYGRWMETVSVLRSAAARLLGCASDEIAITKNTSEGLSFVANGLDWRPGDIVVGIRDEFPANYFPWLRLEKRGVRLRWLDLRNGRVDLEDIDRACDGARLLAISYVQYLSGFRLDLDAIGEICQRRNVLLVVDAVQGLGPFPVDVKRSGIHALSASGHKWLLGPEGCAITFIDRNLMPHVEPVEFGWTNVVGSEQYSHDPSLLPDARRYECGTLNTVGIHGLHASLNLFHEVGVERMADHIHALAQRTVEGAAAKGYEPMITHDRASGSGIITIRKEGADSAAAVRGLDDAGISTAHRFGWIRVAPHFYNSEADIDTLLEGLP